MSLTHSSKYTIPLNGTGKRTDLKSFTVWQDSEQADSNSSEVKKGYNERLMKNKGDAKTCKVCQALNRLVAASTKRLPLKELSDRSLKLQNGEKVRKPRPPRTKFICSVCNISLCSVGSCWNEHLKS